MLFTDTQLLWLFFIHQCLHVWCWKCFGIHIRDIFLRKKKKKQWEMTLHLEKTQAHTHCLHSIWILKHEWISQLLHGDLHVWEREEPEAGSRPSRAWGSRSRWSSHTQTPQAFATLLHMNRTVKLWMTNLDVPRTVRDTHHVLIRRFLGKLLVV